MFNVNRLDSRIYKSFSLDINQFKKILKTVYSTYKRVLRIYSMLENQYRFQIHKNDDIEKYRKDFDKIDNIILDLRDHKLNHEKFNELFERLSMTKIHDACIDFSNTPLDKLQVESFLKAIRTWNLRRCSLNFQNVPFSDEHFNSIVDALRYMANLEKLSLNFQNCKINEEKIRALEKIVEKLTNLECLELDLSRNNLKKEEIVNLSKIMNNIRTRELKWE